MNEYKQFSDEQPKGGLLCLVSQNGEAFYGIAFTVNGVPSWQRGSGSFVEVAPTAKWKPAQLVYGQSNTSLGELKGEDSTERIQTEFDKITFGFRNGQIEGWDEDSDECFVLPYRVAYNACNARAKELDATRHLEESGPVEPSPEDILSSQGWKLSSEWNGIYLNPNHPKVKVQHYDEDMWLIGEMNADHIQLARWDNDATPFLSWLQSEVNRLEGKEPPVTQPWSNEIQEGDIEGLKRAFLDRGMEIAKLKLQLKATRENFESASATEKVLIERCILLQGHLDDAVSKNAQLQMEVRRLKNPAPEMVDVFSPDNMITNEKMDQRPAANDYDAQALETDAMRRDLIEKLSDLGDKVRDMAAREDDEALRSMCFRRVRKSASMVTAGLCDQIRAADDLYSFIKSGKIPCPTPAPKEDVSSSNDH